MERSDQARLCGAVVFALLAVLLLPWLFGSPVDPRSGIHSRFAEDGDAQVLPAPSASPPVTVAAARPAAVPAAVRPSPSMIPVQPATPQPAMVAPRSTRPPQQPTAPRWILQLASFSTAAAADRFAEQLRAQGHVPVTDESVGGGQPIWRVRLLLDGSEAEARRLQQTLDRRYKIQSVLRASP